MALPKLSILFLYLRIFPIKTFRRVTYAIMFVVGVRIRHTYVKSIPTIVQGAAVASCFAAIFQCNPIESQWMPSIPGKCYNVTLFYRLSIQNAITDLVMLVLPLPIVWNLHATRSKKIGVTVVFLMGSIGILASCIRLSVFFRTNAFYDATC